LHISSNFSFLTLVERATAAEPSLMRAYITCFWKDHIDASLCCFGYVGVFTATIAYVQRALLEYYENPAQADVFSVVGWIYVFALGMHE
jgi:hypothetical protein